MPAIFQDHFPGQNENDPSLKLATACFNFFLDKEICKTDPKAISFELDRIQITPSSWYDCLTQLLEGVNNKTIHFVNVLSLLFHTKSRLFPKNCLFELGLSVHLYNTNLSDRDKLNAMVDKLYEIVLALAATESPHSIKSIIGFLKSEVLLSDGSRCPVKYMQTASIDQHLAQLLKLFTLLTKHNDGVIDDFIMDFLQQSKSYKEIPITNTFMRSDTSFPISILNVGFKRYTGGYIHAIFKDVLSIDSKTNRIDRKKYLSSYNALLELLCMIKNPEVIATLLAVRGREEWSPKNHTGLSVTDLMTDDFFCRENQAYIAAKLLACDLKLPPTLLSRLLPIRKEIQDIHMTDPFFSKDKEKIARLAEKENSSLNQFMKMPEPGFFWNTPSHYLQKYSEVLNPALVETIAYKSIFPQWN